MSEYGTIPLIVFACYLIVQAVKTTKIESKWYPVISGLAGAIIAIVLYFVMPTLLPGDASFIAALIIGASSGLAATGTNQVFKQLYKAAQEGTLVVTTETTNKDSDTNKEDKIQ